MPQAKFKIVFNGELMPDALLDEVKDKLAQLFKSDRSKINGLFDGGPIALKRDLSEDEADKYLAALQRTGAKVRKEADLAASLSLVETEDHINPNMISTATSASNDLRMSCPKCGHEQAKAVECEACGIIIDKFLARQAELGDSAPAPLASQTAVAAPASAPLSATPYAPPTANVAEALPEFAELKPFGIEGRIGRLRYLAWSLVMMAVALVLLGIGASVIFILDSSTSLLSVAATIVGLLAVVAMVVVSIQIGVKRLHDIGWSGWLLLVSLIPAVGSVFSIIMLVVPGSTGANRFGPPPPPNSRAVKILAGLWLLVPVLGILAAIAIPQYQDYTERARDAQASGYEETDSAAYPDEAADAADAAVPVEPAAAFDDAETTDDANTSENQ
ncbi:MAG: DUF805 domain-containing protein [Pseudomonas sp.]|uniref:DUF805 domain-containing protein n=1 Tax=Pseudomonas sp. TaxID=306 RepID=UPI002733457A|nr:DUF805 domain-containing protein [Pseudomonas sp.]MDP3845831.1 DUF805 domain-containing protein [Pseudomonas sp.]